ncbi:MAG: hypothetical protein ACFHHU_07115 [Porticoccaceae bacterium]
MKSLPAAIIFAAGIGCALPSMAQTDGTEEPTPMSLLPQVFTRIDYLSVASTNDKETEQTSTSPLPAGNDVEYAEQDLDLALENFFYALEDLMQSASRYEASVETGEHNYFAQVQFPVQVMSSLATGRTSDQATNTATAAAQGSTTLPAIRARGKQSRQAE